MEDAMNNFFMDTSHKDPEKCPKSVEGQCPKCKVDVETGFGIGSGYGYGVYTFCHSCHTFYDFSPSDE